MISILLVEDNLNDAHLVREALEDSVHGRFGLTHVERVREGMHYLRRHRTVDVVLSDISLPDAQGLETFRLLKRASSNAPVIFMTSSGDMSLAVEALKHGAQDYLIKGEYSHEFLARVIRYAIERKKYQDEASRAKAKTRSLRQKTRLLKQEQQQLLELNKAKDDFISLASHQLRTPATGVKQYVGMVLEGFAGEVPGHLRDFLSKAYDSNERQLSIVNDLLQVAQLDAGNMKLQKHRTDLVAMLRSIINEQASKYKQRNQQLDFRTETPAIYANLDAGRMRMVFENLIDNASKYTPEGKRVVVRIFERDGQLAVSVKDEGVGIAERDVEKIFEKFSRVANDRSELVGGSGLGLYWVKRIVDLHDGTIEVLSKPEKGSEFVICMEGQGEKAS